MAFSLLLLASLCSFAAAQFDSSDLSNVTTAFMTAQIVPNVVPNFAPTDLLVVQFPNANVTPGALMPESDVAMEPQFTLEVDPNSNSSIVNSFVIVMVDPDAPNPQMPTDADFLHFIGGDFNPDPVTGLLSNSSPALVEYASPVPPAGSDPHRYVILLYNQPDSFDTDGSDIANSTTSRDNFNLMSFIQQLSLGDPAAGNFFLVGPDGSASSASVSGATPTASPSDGSGGSGGILPTDFSTDNSGSATTGTPPAGATSPTITSGAMNLNIDLRTTFVSLITLVGLLYMHV